MTDPLFEREALALLDALQDIEENERDRWLLRQTQGRPDLKARVEALRSAEKIILIQTGGAHDALGEVIPPDRIGAYRLTGLIGRGGMGAVYRGERDTGDFTHRVAIKIIKPGLLSESLVDRFRRERQILASLSHPHIAQLYDGGETGDGSPYFVMELVDGLPILQWATEQALDRGRRRELFLDVCDAVGFAHRNLIVHRDLTPSNVLVTHDGMVKLIDFGIAKPPASQDQPDAPASIDSLTLTPGYAAPERMTSADVTTAADIYSLGKLLERLVSATGRDTELRAIVARATAERPLDRYPTAEALGEDVAAWGDALPVTAVNGGTTYTLRKFVARHRVGVAAGAGALALLVGALGVTLHANVRAERARAAEQKRFEDVRSLAHYLLFGLNERLRRVVGNTQARADLAAQAQRYLEILAASSAGRDDLKLETAQGLIQLARIQGSPNEPNLGQGDAAIANFRRAMQLTGELSALPAATTGPTLARAQVYWGLIQLHEELKQDDARSLIGSALRTLDGVPKADRRTDWFEARRAVRKAQLELADVGSTPEMLPKIAAAMEADIATWPASMLTSRAAALDRAYAIYYRALHRAMDPLSTDHGLPLYLEGEKRFDALIAADPHDPITLYMASWNANDGFAAASRLGDEVTSDRLVRKANATITHLAALDDRDQAVSALAANIKEGLAQNLRDQDHFVEAVALETEVLDRRKRVATPGAKAKSFSNLAFSQMILGVIARDAGNRTLACSSWTDAVATIERLEKRGQVPGFLKDFAPGLKQKKALCALGAPISGLRAPIR